MDIERRSVPCLSPSLEDRQMKKYIDYKICLEKKREVTLKEIWQSKETIKQLVKEIKKSKHKKYESAKKLKLKYKRTSYEGTKDGNSHFKINHHFTKNESPVRSKNRQEQQNYSDSKNTDIYYNYVK